MSMFFKLVLAVFFGAVAYYATEETLALTTAIRVLGFAFALLSPISIFGWLYFLLLVVLVFVFISWVEKRSLPPPL